MIDCPRKVVIPAVIGMGSFSGGQDVAYIYGDVSASGAIPSGGAAPFHQMRLSDTGNRGCSMFREMVEGEGFSISEHYDQATTLNSAFLDGLDVIVFGLHQKIWSPSEKAALDTWIRGGGGIMMYSDSAAGGHYSQVGIGNTTGQSAVNNVLSAYGMEVTVDVGQGTRAYTSVDDESHPLTQGSLEFEGEGISPVAVDENSGARALYPLESAYQISGGNLSINSANITITDPRWSAIGLQEVGEGSVIAIFDRQPVWNNGEGSDIEKRDNEEVLRRLVKYLAGDLVLPEPMNFTSVQSALVTNSGDGKDYLELSYRQWSGGSGTVGVDYQAGGNLFRVQVSPDLGVTPWSSGAHLVEAVGAPVDQGDGTETVTVRILPSIEEAEGAFARVAIFGAGDEVVSADAGGDLIVHESGTATLNGEASALATVEWRKFSGPGSVSFGDSASATTTANFSQPGNYELMLTASRDGEQVSDLVSVMVVDSADVAVAINCGGGEYLGVNGFSYGADQFFTGGHVDNFPGNPVAGTVEDALYNTARSAHSGYTFTLPDGNYRVYLQFAETFFTDDNKRVFDVSIEGTKVLDDLDLFVEAPGKWMAFDRVYETTVSGGALNLDFSASVNNPLLNAIVVIRD